MRRLNPERTFHLAVDPGLVLAMEQQDVEETVGNLLENAARFCVSGVWITATRAVGGLAAESADAGRRAWVEVSVEDAGPGLDPQQASEAMKRGRRLDQSRPGAGLGLSIVRPEEQRGGKEGVQACKI